MSEPEQLETISAEAIVEAVNLINDYRRQVGLEPLDDLPKGKPGDIGRCILARAFNFDCIVCPYGDPNNWKSTGYGGTIYFSDDKKDQADLLARLLGTATILQLHSGAYAVTLPESLARLARYFDVGRLPQYEE
jgi:hypothetical protein